MAAGQFNAGIDASVAGQNAGFTQSANQFNAGQGNQMAQFNAGLQNQTGLANAAAQNQMNQFNTGLLADTDRFNAAQGLQAAGMNQNARLASGQLGLSAAGQLGQLGAQRQTMGLQGAAALDAIGQQQQALAQARLDAPRSLEAERLGLINNSLGLMDMTAGAGVNSSGTSRSTTTQTSTPGLAQIAGIALQGMALMSDERMKKNIKPVGGGFYSYEMKDTGEKQIGLLAQEVEKRDPGAVITGPDGYKRVDYARATDGLLAEPIREPAPKRRKKKGNRNVG
jgi:hypothetical protein